MFLHVFAFLITILIEHSVSENSCPSQYLRMSLRHTMCKPPNPSCQMLKKGVTQEDKELILQLHNDFRSRIAIGKETHPIVMPEAADMLELTWDDELAEVAQRNTERCLYHHDCFECRSLGHFMVGQSIGAESFSPLSTLKAKDWTWFIKSLYEEVYYFNKSFINSYVVSTGKTLYGHFSQIIWSRTWRIGCGWVLYRDGSYHNSYYVCNYGPVGNVNRAKIYKEGTPCSSCPRNTCCGETCADFKITPKYPGLCKLIDETSPPEGYGPYDSDDILYCDFNNETDCQRTTRGKSNWKLVKTINGNWISISLNGDETTWMMMDKSFKNPSQVFCFTMLLRTGAEVENHPYGFNGTVTFITDSGKTLKFNLRPSGTRYHFIRYRRDVTMPKDDQVMVFFSFSVKSGLMPQFFDIKKISVRRAQCS